MNAINRLIIVLLILVIIILVAVVVIVPKEAFELGRQAFDAAGSYTSAWEGYNWALFATGRVIIGGAVVLILLLVLWLELRRPRKKTVRVQKTSGGEAHIAIDSVAQRLAYNIDQLPDVIKVSPRITSKSRGMDIDLVLETSPDVDVPMKTEEVMQVTKEVVEDRMGLRLGKVTVKSKHAPYPKE